MRCHGSGSADTGGCCHVAGEPCPLRVENVGGRRFACRAALDVLESEPNLAAEASRFEAAWDAHPDYVRLVRPHWRRLEVELGMEPGSYQCSTWTGTGRPECCFAEDPATNAERTTLLVFP